MIFSQKMKRPTSLFYTIVCLALLSLSTQAREKLQCDPPNWWTGMNMNEISLLVRGENFASVKDVKSNSPAAVILSWKIMPNPQYLQLRIQIPNTVEDQIVEFTFISGLHRWKLDFPILQRSGYQPKGLNADDMIYMVYPDRFSNHNLENDSVAGYYQGVNRKGRKTRHGGDLAGIDYHLEYIPSTGATALWLNPILENNQPIDSYHGYATTNSYLVDPRIGTNQEFQKLVAKCHRQDLKLVWDVIYNHWGNEHYLFKNIPDSAWFHWFPTFTKTNYRAETLMDPYASDFDKNLMSNGWFDTHMPDLNQSNPDLAQYLIQNSIWWIEYASLDAFRIDTYAYPDQLFMSQLNEAVKKEYPHFFLFGETWVQGSPIQAWFTQNQCSASFNSHLDGVTDFQTFYAITKGLNENFGWEEGLRRIELTLSHDVIYDNPMNNVIFLDNHDLNRFFSVVNKDINKWKLGIGLLMTLRGIPCVYYGTEWMFEGYTNPDDLVRQEFPGGWQGDEKNYFYRYYVTREEIEMNEYFSTLAFFRKQAQFSKLLFKHFVPEDNMYVYFRYNQNHTYLCVANPEGKKQLPSKRFKEMTSGKTQLNGIIHPTTQPLGEWIELSGEPFEIFELK
jgi:glycosidase